MTLCDMVLKSKGYTCICGCSNQFTKYYWNFWNGNELVVYSGTQTYTKHQRDYSDSHCTEVVTVMGCLPLHNKIPYSNQPVEAPGISLFLWFVTFWQWYSLCILQQYRFDKFTNFSLSLPPSLQESLGIHGWCFLIISFPIFHIFLLLMHE